MWMVLDTVLIHTSVNFNCNSKSVTLSGSSSIIYRQPFIQYHDGGKVPDPVTVLARPPVFWARRLPYSLATSSCKVIRMLIRWEAVLQAPLCQVAVHT